MPELEQHEEALLIRQATRGDADAFGELYRGYAPGVYRFILGNLGDAHNAEDLTGEVFLRVWRALPGYVESGYPFSAFVFKIARNLVIDFYRTHKRETGSLSIEDPAIDETLADPEQNLPELGEHEELHLALQNLRSEYRQILALRFLNDLSIEEIAMVMNRSSGAVRVLQHRALMALRKSLGVK